jgi:DNA recombination protein RmuC
MDVISVAVGIIVGAVVSFIVLSLVNKTKSVSRLEFENLSSELNQARTDLAVSQGRENDRAEALARTNDEKESLAKQFNELNASNAVITAELRAAKENLERQKKEIETLHEQTLLQFEKLANEILETKSRKFAAANQENIERILQPLGKEISEFKRKVEETYDKEAKERFSLSEKVADLIQHTGKISEEANNLAAALKGQAKRQGDWGEIILERVLEAAGLERGREYEVQGSFRGEDGNLLRPDVLVHLPDNRTVIIDSKVSLNAYESFCSSDEEEQQKAFVRNHLQSIYSHIDSLHEKKYDQISSSLDFTMMFVPIEPAYHLAVQCDDQLWDKAYKKRIILISPTNLLAVIKLISDLWSRDRQSKQAMNIAKRGQALYDKLIGFLDTFGDVGVQLGKAQKAFDTATSQLKQNKGNVIWQAEQLKAMGIDSKKSLPAYVADYEDDAAEPVVALPVPLIPSSN